MGDRGCYRQFINVFAGQLLATMAHLANSLASPEQLFRRGTLNSLPSDLLDAIFFSAQCLTQAAGLLLQLPQSVTAQANVLLARFWLVEPVMSHEFSVSSAELLHPCSLIRVLTVPRNRMPPPPPSTSSPRWAPPHGPPAT